MNNKEIAKIIEKNDFNEICDLIKSQTGLIINEDYFQNGYKLLDFFNNLEGISRLVKYEEKDFISKGDLYSLVFQRCGDTVHEIYLHPDINFLQITIGDIIYIEMIKFHWINNECTEEGFYKLKFFEPFLPIIALQYQDFKIYTDEPKSIFIRKGYVKQEKRKILGRQTHKIKIDHNEYTVQNGFCHWEKSVFDKISDKIDRHIFKMTELNTGKIIPLMEKLEGYDNYSMFSTLACDSSDVCYENLEDFDSLHELYIPSKINVVVIKVNNTEFKFNKSDFLLEQNKHPFEGYWKLDIFKPFYPIFLMNYFSIMVDKPDTIIYRGGYIESKLQETMKKQINLFFSIGRHIRYIE